MRKLAVILGVAGLLAVSSGFKDSVTLAQTGGTITDSAQLALPASAFLSDYKQSASEGWPASKADSSTFAGMHQKPYSALGLQGAWYQYAAKFITVDLGSTILVSPLEVGYLGTYYMDTAAASNAYADIGVNSTLSNPAACSFGTRCTTYKVALVYNGVTYIGMVRVIQQGNALAEIRTDTAQFTADNVQAITYVTNLDLASQAFVSLVGGSQATDTPLSTPTSTPAPPTLTPTSVPPTSTPTPTATATSTPTQTPIPLFVHVSLKHKTVKIGTKQTVAVTTLAGAHVSVTVAFPDGSKKHHSGTADAAGTHTWTYSQPAPHKAVSKRTVKVAVTVTDGNSMSMTSTATYAAGP
ncbi:MAG TPA: hypothetical protein VIO57_13680 [Chloroflexota bacterium]|jgi:hypothetical protein